MTSQAIMLPVLGSTHLAMGRRHPRGLGETEACWAQKAGGAQTPTAAAGPCRSVEAWACPPATRGRTERPQSLGFRFLERCCQRIRAKGHLCCLGVCASALPIGLLSLLPSHHQPSHSRPQQPLPEEGRPGPERKGHGLHSPTCPERRASDPSSALGFDHVPSALPGRPGSEALPGHQPQESGDTLLFGHRVNGIRTECPHS